MERGLAEDSTAQHSGSTDPQKKVGLDSPHPQEACQQHHRTGSDLESTGEEKHGKSQEHMAPRHRGRNAEKRSLLDGAGEGSPELGALEDCCRWPMLLVGAKGLSE